MDGRNGRIVEVPVPGKVVRAFLEGAQLAPEGRYGKITWEEFLNTTVRPGFHGMKEEKLA